MKGISRRLLLPLAMVLGLVGVAPPTAAAAALTDTQAQVTTSPERLLKGGWETHEWNFKSKASCESRRVVFNHQYMGYWVGGVAESRCASYVTATCPPKTLWSIQARTWYSENGPFVVPLRAQSQLAAPAVPNC